MISSELSSAEPALPRNAAGIDHRVWCVPEFGLIYIRNGKAGCSTIQQALWKAVSPETYGGNPHDLARSPSRAGFATFRAHLDQVEQATVFSAVRNPYVRFVSAYVDKVLRKETRGRTWAGMASQYGFPHRSFPTPEALLERLAADDPDAIDVHFRTQHRSLLHPEIRPQFVGHLEDMDAIAAFLQERGIGGIGKHVPHATGASDRLFGILNSDRLIASVYDLYRKDFELYGYSEDPSAPAPAKSPLVAEDKNAGMVELFSRLPLRGRAKLTAIPSDRP